MSNLIDSLAATTIAVALAGAVPNIADASEKAPLDPIQAGKTASVIVSAEKETNSHHRAKINVMLKGYDPVAYSSKAEPCGANVPFRALTMA
jgi:hypothetical protein